MSQTRRKMEDSGVECDLNGQIKGVSDGKNFSVLPRDHSSDILEKNVVTF